MDTQKKTHKNNLFDTIPQAIEDFRQGKILIVVDDEDRENEGDFIMAAERITPDRINFMAKYGRGMARRQLKQYAPARWASTRAR